MRPDPQWVMASRPRSRVLKAVCAAGLGPDLAVRLLQPGRAYSLPEVNLLGVQGQSCAAQALCPATGTKASVFQEAWYDFQSHRLGAQRRAGGALRRLLGDLTSADYFGPTRSPRHWWCVAVLSIALASRRFGVLPQVDGDTVLLRAKLPERVMGVEQTIDLDMGVKPRAVWDLVRQDFRPVAKPAADAGIFNLSLGEQSTTNPLASAHPDLAWLDQQALCALVRRIDLGLEPQVEPEELLLEPTAPPPNLAWLSDVIQQPLPLEQLRQYLVPAHMTATDFRRIVGNAWQFPDRVVQPSTLGRLAEHLGVPDAI